MIPETTLNLIQERVDIVEIIGAHVSLRRSGKNFKANCPFHLEKSPSFMVNPDKQIFHCFGCGVGGNVFTFLMKFEKKDFREVAEALAERAGVEIPKERSDDAGDLRRAELLKANRLATDYYQRVLWKEESAAKARAYLKARGLSEATVQEFSLGYAPDAWDALLTTLKKDCPEKILESAGLVSVGKEGKIYDRFRKRIIFPIADARGQVVAFGARVLDDSLPKYLNSPETELYTKGRQLYGLSQARTAIRTQDVAIVVEGYMDVIGCHQAGVKNVVASLGTALTPEQARLLKRHTSNVVILYDADKAGEAATLRGLEIFLEEGMDVKIVRLPDGHDPDTYILKQGLEAFTKALAAAKNLFEYKLALLKTKYPDASVDARVKIANEMVSLFARVKNEILRAAWTTELARALGISEKALTAELVKAQPAAPPARLTATEKKPAANAPARTAETLLLGLLAESGAYARALRSSLKLEDFQNVVVRRLMEKFFTLTDDEAIKSSSWLASFRADAEAMEVLAMATAEADNAPDKDKVFEDCVRWLERSRLTLQRETLREEIAQAHRSGDRGRIDRLLKDFAELNKGMKKNS